MVSQKSLKIIIGGAITCLGLFIFSGCSLSLKNFGSNLGKKYQEEIAQEQNSAINFWENNKAEKEKAQVEEFIKKGLLKETKNAIDQWIKDNNLNNYGDPKNIMYAGGTPLFDEATGEITDRYAYILRNHPELIKKLKLTEQ